MDPNRPIAMVQGQLPPVQLPDPPAKRGRKAQSQGGPARKRSKKADGNDDATSAPEAAAAAAAAGGKPPTGRRGGKAGGGGRAKSSKQQDKDDDGLELEERVEVVVEEEPEEKLGKTHSGVFSKDLPWLMYGFGDADKPIKETVDLVEDIAVQFVTETVHAAMASAALRTSTGTTAGGGNTKQKKDVDLDDLLFAVRRDPRKVARIQELIRRQKEIQDARKTMDVDAEAQ